MKRARRLLPDVALVGGLALALAGAYLITPPLVLLVLGVALVGLSVWMTS